MPIATVLGPISVARLGKTLMHEHIFTGFAELQAEYPRDCQAQDELAVRLLRSLKETGFDSIVDMTVFGLGRNVARIAAIAKRASINVIAATGVYTFADMPTYFRGHTQRVDENFLSTWFIREIEDGIGTTGIRAGIIKFAVDAHGVTPDIAIIIEQAAIAQRHTGVAISTHTHNATQTGLMQQDLLRQAGVDLGRVVIGHVGDSTDFDYLERLIENGSWLGMDRFGWSPGGGLEQRMDTVAEMCARGYASRMVLSHDTNVASDNTPEQLRDTEEFRDWRYRSIPDVVLPGLLARGVSQEDIDTMTVRNPAAILPPA